MTSTDGTAPPSAPSTEETVTLIVNEGSGGNTQASPVLSFTTINDPGATSTYAFDINNAGEIVGQTSLSGQEFGWLYDGSSFHTIQYPSAHNTSFGWDQRFGVVVGHDEPFS